jgi:hypothetical protein
MIRVGDRQRLEARGPSCGTPVWFTAPERQTAIVAPHYAWLENDPDYANALGNAAETPWTNSCAKLAGERRGSQETDET